MKEKNISFCLFVFLSEILYFLTGLLEVGF